MEGVLRVSKGGKGRFIAPGLDDDDADRNPLPAAALDFVHHPRLRVPLVPAHPGPKDPARRKLGTAGALEEGGEHLGRGTFPEPEVDCWIRLAWIEGRLDPEAVHIGFADIEPGASRGLDMKAAGLATGDD